MFYDRKPQIRGTVTISRAHRLRPGAGMAAMALACGLCAAGPARAAHIVEFQIQTSKLLELVEHRLVEEEVCVLNPFQLPGSSVDVVLDHLEFPAPPQLQGTFQQLQIVAPVEIYTKTAACIVDPTCGPQDYTPADPLLLSLVFDLTAHVDGNGMLNLCITPSSGGLLQAIGFNALVCSTIDVMNPLQGLLNGQPAIKQVGITADGSFGRIAIRIEFDNPANPGAPPDSSWDTFFLGDTAGTDGRPWGIFIDKHLLLDVFKARFASNLNVTEGPTATWEPLGDDGGNVVIDLEADFDVPVCPNSIGADATVVTHLFVDANEPNIIKSHGTIATDVIDSDVALCAFLIGGPSPAFPGILTTLAILAAGQGPSNSDLPDECTLNEDGDVFDCANPVVLPVIRLSEFNTAWSSRATLTMGYGWGSPDGLLLSGPCDVFIGLPPNPRQLLETGPGEFTFGVKGGCYDLHYGWTGSLPIRGDGRLCTDIQVIDDPKGVFQVNWVGNHPMGADYIGNQTLDIVFPAPGSDPNAYFAAGAYPCRLRIRTSVGSQCVEVGTPPGVPDQGSQEWADLLWEMIHAKELCMKLVVQWPRAMDVLWLGDPPPFDLQTSVRLWDRYVSTPDVAAQLNDLQVSFDQPIEAEVDDGGGFQATAVTMRVQANVSMPEMDFAAPRAARAKTSAKRAPQSADGRNVTIDHLVTVDLAGHVNSDGAAELKPTQDIVQVVKIPADQLPDGVSEMSFVLDLPAETIALRGRFDPLDVVADDSVPEFLADPIGACGDGACGTGSAIALPLMSFGWITLRHRGRRYALRHRRSADRHGHD
ncbi:MAG: hypothetical protein JXQ75_11915 [Phycisphaerae bacterium]|nr:hypothetical protein [Phycisphaerae bacterium]